MSAVLAVLLLGCMLPPVVAAETVQGRITFVGTAGEVSPGDRTRRAQFKFKVSESTCSTTDGLWTNVWNGGPPWTGWTQLVSQPLASDPAAVSRAPNRIHVFALGTDARMYMMAWDGTRWSSWSPLGSQLFNSGPAVASWAADRLDVFARGTDNALWSNALIGSDWSGWTPLAPNAIGSRPAAVSWGPNRIDVFALGTDNKMYTMIWDGTGTRWPGWRPLGLGGNETFTSGPAVASPAPDRLELFAPRGPNNALWTNSLTGGQWTGWSERAPQPIGSVPAAVSWGPDRIDVFARRPDDQIYTMARVGTQWTGWISLGGERFAGGPAVASGVPNRLDLFSRGRLRAERWIQVVSGRMDGDFQHNSADFRNAYNTVLSGFLARTVVNVMVTGVPSCDETQTQSVALETSSIGILP